MSSNILYRIGDATSPVIPKVAGDANGQPKQPTNLVIVHICNDIGGWGRGFVLALSKRYPQAEKAYRTWYSQKINPLPFLAEERREPFELGQVQFVPVQTAQSSEAEGNSMWVGNMIAQHGIANGKYGTQPPIRYEALSECLAKVAEFTSGLTNASVHMPRIGAGLAGGDWNRIAEIIEHELVGKGIPVMVYDLK
jgi:O-acetyl-ADP-ribose deacetylase (regulator of RNase III)